jgi:hypothetical protein
MAAGLLAKAVQPNASRKQAQPRPARQDNSYREIGDSRRGILCLSRCAAPSKKERHRKERNSARYKARSRSLPDACEKTPAIAQLATPRETNDAENKKKAEEWPSPICAGSSKPL